MNRSLIFSTALLAATLGAGCAGGPNASAQALATRAPPAGPIVEGQSVPVTTFDTVAAQQALLASPDPKLAANKKLVYDWWRETLAAGHTENADRYQREDYIQHNPAVATGRAAFLAFFGRGTPREIKPTIDNLVSIVAEGDLVIFAFKREMTDANDATKKYTTTWFDMMRVQDGKVAEHWDYGTKR